MDWLHIPPTPFKEILHSIYIMHMVVCTRTLDLTHAHKLKHIHTHTLVCQATWISLLVCWCCCCCFFSKFIEDKLSVSHGWEEVLYSFISLHLSIMIWIHGFFIYRCFDHIHTTFSSPISYALYIQCVCVTSYTTKLSIFRQKLFHHRLKSFGQMQHITQIYQKNVYTARIYLSVLYILHYTIKKTTTICETPVRPDDDTSNTHTHIQTNIIQFTFLFKYW